MTTHEVTIDNLQAMTADGVVFLDFWAQWCGPCRAFAPVFERAAEKYPTLVFGKIDTEAQPELAARFQITSIPTLMAFRDGIKVFNQPGALSAGQLAKVVDGVLALDMTEVRAQVGAKKHGADL